MSQGDRVIRRLRKGKMVRVLDPLGDPNSPNFLIVCAYGDWSGFRTLAECELQFPDLESRGKADGFFEVVER